MNEAAQIVDNIQAESVPTQPPATPPAEPSKPDDKISSRLEVLIRREQAAVQRERAAKARESDIESKLQKLTEFESVKTNPKKALELLGLDYNELTQSLLNDGNLTPDIKIKKVEDKFDQFLKTQEEEQKKRQEEATQRAKQEEEKIVSDFKSEINQHLKDNSSRYELISFEAAEELVFDVIDEHYKRTIDEVTGIGKIMGIAEAADKVEAHLEQKYNKSKDLSKVKALWQAVPKATIQQALKADTKSNQAAPKTLTNSLQSQAPPPKRSYPLTDEERIQKALAWFKNQGVRP